jgi:hypothetical protein
MENLRWSEHAGHPMRLLAAGVPLTLLVDLVCPSGPDSEHIAVSEQPAAVA